jgi:sulfatase maturation enzyme AslB (radical SAM superfamily)
MQPSAGKHKPICSNVNFLFGKIETRNFSSVLVYCNVNWIDLLCKFKNVHWTVSVETIEEQYEYVRYHGSWNDFLQNLKQIQKLDHKITFNMLYFILNYKSIFSTVDFFKEMEFHENSFIIGPLYTPEYLNILNLPENMLSELKSKFINELTTSNHYLKNSYENILKYVSNTPWNKDISNFQEQIKILDARRNQSARAVFPELFRELKNV